MKYGERLSCGCCYGYERCMECRAGLHSDQLKALAISSLLRTACERFRSKKMNPDDVHEVFVTYVNSLGEFDPPVSTDAVVLAAAVLTLCEIVSTLRSPAAATE